MVDLYQIFNEGNVIRRGELASPFRAAIGERRETTAKIRSLIESDYEGSIPDSLTG